MSLTEQIEKLVSEKSEKLAKDASFQALKNFYEAAKRDGVAKTPEYNLPQVDTIGRLGRQAE